MLNICIVICIIIGDVVKKDDALVVYTFVDILFRLGCVDADITSYLFDHVCFIMLNYVE